MTTGRFEPIEPNGTPHDDMSGPDLGLGNEAALPLQEQPGIDGIELTQPGSKSWQWFLLMLSTCGVFGALGVSAFIWLASLPPMADCQKISPLSPDMERLYCAQQAAQSGELSELLAGIELLEQWTPEHPLYPEAQRWLDEWSESVLVVAKQRVKDSDLKGALELVQQIPPGITAYEEAQALKTEWQTRWKEGEAIYATAQAALKAQNWDQVSQQIAILSEFEQRYWRSERVNALSQQLLLEKQGRQIYAKAQAAVKSDDPQQLKAGMTLLADINQETYAWKDAQPLADQWGETLLTYGFEKWKSTELDEAIAVAQLVSLSPNLKVDAEDLLRLSRARKMAIATSTNWEVRPKHLWNLVEAIEAARLIGANSRYYGTAQNSLKSWAAQLEDLKQIQFAQITARLGTQTALKLAIDQVQQVQVGRPRRMQAQTLAAHWASEIERREDEPFITRAEALAEQDTVPALKAAIAEAGQVQLGRVLRGKAQGLIYIWNHRIQTIEDQPFLTMARSLARQGKLSEAIEAAAVIRPGRALYPTAQGSIRSWRAQIRAIELERQRKAEAEARARAAALEAQAAEETALEQPQFEPMPDLFKQPQESPLFEPTQPNYNPIQPRRAIQPQPRPVVPPIQLAPAPEPVQTAPVLAPAAPSPGSPPPTVEVPPPPIAPVPATEASPTTEQPSTPSPVTNTSQMIQVPPPPTLESSAVPEFSP